MRDNSQQRRGPRSPVEMAGRCRVGGTRQIFVALIDLTPEGCCVMTMHPTFRLGQKVMLWPDNLAAMNAQVKWNRGYLAGLLFDQPLYAPVFDHLAREFRRSDSEDERRSLLSLETGLLQDDLRDRLLGVLAEAERQQARLPGGVVAVALGGAVRAV